jgi:hypothetical protein
MEEKQQHSLIQNQPNQSGDLFSTNEMNDALFAKDEKKGHFTGERLFKRRPDVYKQICVFLGEGVSVNRVAKLMRVSVHTVLAVRDREPDLIAAEKERTIGNMRKFVRLSSERLIDEVDKIPLQSLPVAMGIAVDKGELLAGQATSRIEHVNVPSHTEFNKLIELLPSDVTEMGLDAAAGVTKELGCVTPVVLPGSNATAATSAINLPSPGADKSGRPWLPVPGRKPRRQSLESDNKSLGFSPSEPKSKESYPVYYPSQRVDLDQEETFGEDVDGHLEGDKKARGSRLKRRRS